ncbi:MAG TPA: exopolysaccharide biosynthesis polyprenyl glycosylphosphotransferase [Rhizomicrobium sp.]|nr:exopolysaccharide biosynthesis polyprenyl glycosylphosphotransferase [Rhizomicrobium sp.]
MSLIEPTAKSFQSVQPHRDAFHAASDDLANAFRFSPDALWAAANANDRPAVFAPALKRALDLIVAVPMLLFCAPLLAALALIVRLDSKGPVLFRQTRLGKNGKAFSIFKFRTMRVVEDGDTVVQAQKNDARVTRSGSWMRRTSLDELPQLLNVLTGDMSIVGPRPHARAHDIHYAARIGNYEMRQDVKPGITGWAQINGLRGETPTTADMRARVDFDIWYARNASLLLDLQIMLRTPFAVLGGRNAH